MRLPWYPTLMITLQSRVCPDPECVYYDTFLACPGLAGRIRACASGLGFGGLTPLPYLGLAYRGSRNR